jgi:hypothetical protein
MPDRRKHRGAHPEDERCFSEQWHEALRRAVEEYSWLLSRDYAEESALALVGNRYSLTERQRLAVRRASCSDESRDRRLAKMISTEQCRGHRLGIDGYNVLITVESALSGGPILLGRDGCCRDLASIHGTYRKVDETVPAVELIARHLEDAGLRAVDWYLDRPVSNSGRLKQLMAEVPSAGAGEWNIELVDSADPVLAEYDGVVATSDSWILDRCGRWVNLSRDIVESSVPGAWKVQLIR